MRPGLLELEPRDALSAPADLGGGVVRVRTGWEVVAFPGYAGPLQVIDTGRTVEVGAGEGGGPRVAEFDPRPATPVRLSDRFVGDPESRHGATLVPVGVPTGDPRPRPHLSAGDGFAVYVDEERDVAPEDTAAVVDALPGLFPGVPLAFGTDRPDGPAGSYATVVLGAPLDWFAAGTLGLAVGRWDAVHPDQLTPQSAYVVAGLTPAYTAVVAAHELGHFFGLPHVVAPRPNLMNTPVDAAATFDADQLAEITAHLPGV